MKLRQMSALLFFGILFSKKQLTFITGKNSELATGQFEDVMMVRLVDVIKSGHLRLYFYFWNMNTKYIHT